MVRYPCKPHTFVCEHKLIHAHMCLKFTLFIKWMRESLKWILLIPPSPMVHHDRLVQISTRSTYRTLYWNQPLIIGDSWLIQSWLLVIPHFGDIFIFHATFCILHIFFTHVIYLLCLHCTYICSSREFCPHIYICISKQWCWWKTKGRVLICINNLRFPCLREENAFVVWRNICNTMCEMTTSITSQLCDALALQKSPSLTDRSIDTSWSRHKERLRIFIVHKETKFDKWDQSIHVFLLCVSLLKRGIHTLKYKVSMRE